MRFCTICNHVLEDGDAVCPNCAGKDAEMSRAAQHPAAPPENEKTDVSQSNETELPDMRQIAATIQTARQASERTWDNGSAKRAATNSFTIEIPLNRLEQEMAALAPSAAPAQSEGLLDQTIEISLIGEEALQPAQENNDEQDEVEDFDFRKGAGMNDENGAIERVLEEDEIIQQATAKKIGLGKLEMTLILVLALAVVVFGVLLMIKFSSTGEQEEDYFEKFVGTWVSDFFHLYDDDGQELEGLFCEKLIIREDGSFIRRTFVVNRAIPDGYLNDEWEVFEEISGTIKYFEDSRALALFVTEEKVFYDRYVIELGSTHMTLREFFGEEQQDFFDIQFVRMQ